MKDYLFWDWKISCPKDIEIYVVHKNKWLLLSSLQHHILGTMVYQEEIHLTLQSELSCRIHSSSKTCTFHIE